MDSILLVNKSNEEERLKWKNRSNIESVLLCNHFPLSTTISQSCGKRSNDRSNRFLLCLVIWISLGMSAISANVPNIASWTSLVVQWRVICLPVQGAWVQSLVQEDSICCEASKPVCHNYWAFVPQEKPPWWEALALQWRPSAAEKKKCCLLYLYIASVSFTPAELKKIYNLKVKSYILFGRNFEDFKLGRQHINLSNLALFCVWEDARIWAHRNHFLNMYPSFVGACIPYLKCPQGSPQDVAAVW